MRTMTKSGPPEGKASATALLARMHSSLSEWLAMPPGLEQCAAPCRAWRAQLHEVACQARSAGLYGFSSLSVRIGEQLEPSFQSNDLPRSEIRLLWRWSHASLQYLRDDADLKSAVGLVGLLRLSYANYYGAKERALLLRNLIEDLESDGMRGARSESSSCYAGRC